MLSLMPEGAIVGAIRSGASVAAVTGAAVASAASLQRFKAIGRRRQHLQPSKDNSGAEGGEGSDDDGVEADASEDDSGMEDEQLRSDAGGLIYASWQHTKASWGKWLRPGLWMLTSLKGVVSWTSAMLLGKGALRDNETVRLNNIMFMYIYLICTYTYSEYTYSEYTYTYTYYTYAYTYTYTCT
jgi:hypothetical protein